MISQRWYSQLSTLLKIFCRDRDISFELLAEKCGCDTDTFLNLCKDSERPMFPRWLKYHVAEQLQLNDLEYLAYRHLLDDFGPVQMYLPKANDMVSVRDYDNNNIIMFVKAKDCKYRKCFDPAHIEGAYVLMDGVLFLTAECYCCASVAPGEKCHPKGYDFQVLHPDCSNPLIVVKKDADDVGMEIVAHSCITCGQFIDHERAKILIALRRFRWLKAGREAECKSLIRKKSLERKTRFAAGVREYYLLTLKHTPKPT